MIPMRPMRLGEILDAAFRLYRATFVEVIVLVAITLGAFNALGAVVQGPQPGLFDTATFEAVDSTTQIVRAGLGGLVFLIAQLFVYPLVRGGATGIALERDRGGDSTWQAGLRLSLRLAGRLLRLAFLLLFAGIVAVVFVAAAAILPAIGFAQADLVPLAVVWGILAAIASLALGLVVSALIRLAVPVVVVEHVGAIESLRRSYRLVRPQLLRIIGIVVLTVLLLGIVSSVFGVLQVGFTFVGGIVGVIATIVLTTVSLMITVPLEANIALLLYVDARIRFEGLDVAVLTAELDAAT